ncbi:MAG: transcriptional repressor [Oscillospiraceae bacterium]|nr:transcriptional repressor [Oscillospiraceae bacterium]
MEKHSKKRDAIYDIICSTKSHPSAEWVYTQVKEIHPDISLGTVYRNIARFKEEGKIITVGVVNGQERIDGDTSDHCHFVCTHCGAVIDAGAPDVTDTYSQVFKDIGCTPERHNLVFYGRCHDCTGKRS